jgi:glycosyltransferase involved in cell wall biosynthesis
MYLEVSMVKPLYNKKSNTTKDFNSVPSQTVQDFEINVVDAPNVVISIIYFELNEHP